jgi:hypothetical protein
MMVVVVCDAAAPRSIDNGSPPRTPPDWWIDKARRARFPAWRRVVLWGGREKSGLTCCVGECDCLIPMEGVCVVMHHASTKLSALASAFALVFLRSRSSRLPLYELVFWGLPLITLTNTHIHTTTAPTGYVSN